MANSTDDTNKNGNDEDNFGLPDLEYKPLDQLESSKAEEASKAQEEKEIPVYDEEEEETKSGAVIAILVGLVLLVGGFLAYKYVWIPKRDKARQAQIDKDKAEADKKAEEERQARLAEEERQRREAAANAKPAEGTIETLSDRTGRYYVVVSSSVDGDLAMDKAKKLSATGKSTKIIPPFGKWKFYRLCIGDFDTFASAQSSADASKSEYGEALWVLKY
ncbi:hypothetical protein WSM22_28210 [Cytophagales bacterium WSM2-2]|nr:hypothetical protein WSM22_28210 [Cytophagales bacterium WSM2-2]